MSARTITVRGPWLLLGFVVVAAVEWWSVPVLWGAGWPVLAVLTGAAALIPTMALTAILILAADTATTKRSNPWRNQ